MHDVPDENIPLEKVMDTVLDGIITIDSRGTILRFNTAALRLFGYRIEEVLGQNVSLLMPEPYRSSHDGYIHNYTETGEKKIIGIGREVTGQRKDGSIFPMELGISEVLIGPAKRCFVGIVRDISERKAAEEQIRINIKALRESEERYKLVVDCLSLGIWDWNVTNNDLFWTPRFKEILCATGELKDIYSVWEDRLHPEDKAFVLGRLQGHLKDRTPYDVEYRLLRDDGHYVWIHARGNAVWDSTGTALRMIGSIEDITWRKTAEQKLKDETSRLKAVMDTVIDGLITIDGMGIIRSFNPSAVRIFGYQPDEVISKNVRMLMPEPYRSGHDGYLSNYLSTGERKVIGIGREVTALRKDGTVFPIELGINEMEIKGQRMFVGTIRDITERVEHEQHRKKLLNRLFESNSELERFAYVASHDLQEPIRMINSFSKILLSDYQNILGAEGKEYLTMVTDCGERMRDVVYDLLEYSRVGSETNKFHMFDCNMALASALENLKELIKEHSAKVTQDRLPEIYGSPVQIMRMFQNLIANAIKYQPTGNIPVIHVGLEDDGDYWRIFVRDNGIGIDNRFLKQIFEPFRRLHTWDSIKGSGLGLAICKKIAESNGGQMNVVSNPGKGSIFSFIAPKCTTLKRAV